MGVFSFALCSKFLLLSADSGLLHGKELGSTEGNNCLHSARASLYSLSLPPLSTHTCAKQCSLWSPHTGASSWPAHIPRTVPGPWVHMKQNLCSKTYLSNSSNTQPSRLGDLGGHTTPRLGVRVGTSDYCKRARPVIWQSFPSF